MPERNSYMREIKPDKFEETDIPLILATLKRAHEGKKFARVTVDFSKDGGSDRITDGHERYPYPDRE